MSNVNIRNMSKAYDGRINAVKQLDLTINEGEFFVLLGPSGCGKTTTLRCIAGLEEPEKGQILIDEDVVLDTERGKFIPPERRDIGMVFQSYALWPHMSVWDNVAYPIKTRKKVKEAEKRQIQAALELVGLKEYANRYPTELSGGQQQRVALARAIVSHPRVLLFDEPLSNLDASLRIKLRLELRRLQKEIGYTAIYVTHDHSEALALADRVAIMRNGYLEQIGTPGEIFLQPKSRYVAEFIGFENILDARISKNIDDNQSFIELNGHGSNLIAQNLNAIDENEDVLIALRASQIIGTALDEAHDGLLTNDQILGKLETVGYSGDFYLAIVRLIKKISNNEFEATDIVVQAHLPLSIWGADIEYVNSQVGKYINLNIQNGSAVILSDKGKGTSVITSQIREAAE